MIYRNGKLVTLVYLNLLVKDISKLVQKDIGAIYKGALLVWLTVKEAIKSCYGGGTWIQDKYWLDNDYWKNE